MLSDKIQEALNKQINAELYSSYLYLSMSAYFESINLAGFASWMRAQAQEELFHAMKFFNFVNERQGRVDLRPIEGPQTEWESPAAVFEATYAHERHVTELIYDLADMAEGEKDRALRNLLEWFVAEQVEEESSADKVLQQLKLAGDDRGALFMIDKEMATRVFTMPTAAE